MTSHRLNISNLNRPITKDFTAKDWFVASKGLPAEKESWKITGIPIAKNIPLIAQKVSDYSKSDVNIGSAHRTDNWEIYKKREGGSKHVSGWAVDLNGEEVLSLLYEAYTTKNKLYHELKKLGVTAYGFYSWGVHLDIRPKKASGIDYIWFDDSFNKNLIKSKKKVLTRFIVATSIAAILYKLNIFS